MSAANVSVQLIKSIPPAILKTLPAGPPPPGIQPNFGDPPTRVPVILGVGTAFLLLAVLCISIRLYTKLVIAKKWTWDDVTCSLGFMLSIVYYVVVVQGCINGVAGRHLWDVRLDKVLNNSSLYQNYITTIMVTPALGLIKSSLFIQYYLLFRALRWVRISVWIGATLSAVFYITVTVMAFVLCSPWPGESLLEGMLSWHYFKFADFSIPTGVVGMLVDWYLLILPIPAVLGLQMSKARKLGVLIIFMTGTLAAIGSTMSLYYRIQLQDLTDPTWRVGYVLLWAQIEMFAGVAASSMPTVRLFFSRQNFSFRSRSSSVQSNVARILNRSPQEKLPDYHPGFTHWAGGSYDTNNSDLPRGGEGPYRMQVLSSA